MRAVVNKWGHSLAIRVPSRLGRSRGIAEGTAIDLTEVDNGALELRPAGRTLEEMVKGITPEYVHGEASFGGPTGRESL